MADTIYQKQHGVVRSRVATYCMNDCEISIVNLDRYDTL